MNRGSRSNKLADEMFRSARLRPSRSLLSIMLAVVVGLLRSHLFALARPHDDCFDCGHNSTQVSQRLMQELKDFYKSDSYKRGLFTVDLIDDNIYEWNVKLFVLDKEIPMYWDLRDPKKNRGNDHILLHVKYNENYPNEPPFVRVVYPFLSGLLTSGAICMELLGPGWNRNYTIEHMVLSIAVKLTSETRVRNGSTRFYNYEAAKEVFDAVTRKHLKDGSWTTTPAFREA